ncbi:cytochrome b5 domain-containing protein 1-like [Ciona intestinalis]
MAPGRPKYFTPNEVSLHNTIKDVWVSYLGKVYDLTPLCDEYAGDILLKPIIASAGKDISHWFDSNTGDIRTHIDPSTGIRKYYAPHGRFVHIPPPCPASDWSNDFGRPWWKDNKYEVGVLSDKTRLIRIINTLTSQEQTIEVCCEENMNEILQRYLKYNGHAASYTWKYDGIPLSMNKTLKDNGIEDEDIEFYELGMDYELWTPAMHLYFNDDLTEA